MPNEREEKYIEMMRDHAKELSRTEQSLGGEYAKSLSTLSGGALGLSFTLVSGAFETHLEKALCYLWISWILFALCIVFVVFSVKMGQMAFRKEIKAIYNEIEKGAVSTKAYSGCLVKASEYAEYCAGSIFLFGIIFFLIFIITNIN